MTPALRYTVYLFDGPRAGLTLKPTSYRMCIYDSAQNSDGSTYSPTPPAIKQPKFSIEENSAGSLEFTLLHNATALLHVSTTSNPEPHLIDDTPRPITTYIFLKQTEIVLTRSVMYDTKPGQTAPEIKTEEIWAGRISSIKKDFYGNWNVFAEGELSYLNDFTTDAGTFSVKDPKVILTSLVNQYNAKVNTFSTYTVGNDRAIAFLPIDRTFEVFTVSTGITYTPGVSIKDLATTFEVQSGESFWTAMQNLLDQFGGHFEITKTIRNVTINGTVVQRTRRLISWYANDEYHKYNATTSQAIRFGTNLLDYTEELDATEMFTVIRPLGATNTTTTKNETTGEETSVTTTVDISSVNNGSPYYFKNEVVDKYGCIEKVVTWGDIQQPDALFAVAKEYYNDLHIGEPNITINAYDLKNLLSLSDESPSLPDKESIKQIDSLFLYDKVAIISPYHGYTSSSKQVPITKIEIPLDKFPTDTVYTMSTKAPPRNSLLPGSSIKQLKKETEKNTDEVNKIVDPGHTKPDYTPEYVTPTSGELGIDENTPHWPMIFLNRAAPYPTGSVNFVNDPAKSMTGEFTISISAIVRKPTSIDPDATTSVTETITGQWSGIYGIKKKIENIRIASGLSTGTKNAISGFFSDDITDTQAITRIRTPSQNLTNWYQIMEPLNGSDTSTLTPFTSGYASQYSIPGPEINASQPWSHLYSGGEVANVPVDIDNYYVWNDDPGTPSEDMSTFFKNKILTPFLNGLTAAGMNIEEKDGNGTLYLTLVNKNASTEGGPEKLWFPILHYRSLSSTSKYSYNLCTIGVLQANDAVVIYAKPWTSGNSGETNSLGWINYQIDHRSDSIPSFGDDFIKCGCERGWTSIEIIPAQYRSEITQTYHRNDAADVPYMVLDETPAPGGSHYETTKSWYGKIISADKKAEDGTISFEPISYNYFYNTIMPSLTNTANRMAQLVAQYRADYDQSGFMDRMTELRYRAFENAEALVEPILVIAKSKDASTGSDSYSAIVGTIGYGESVRIDSTGVASNYTTGITSQESPLMIGEDSYLYLTIGQSHQPVPGIVTSSETYKSPICLMSKCGGLQTKQVANNVYMQLCGAPEGIDGSGSSAWGGGNVVYLATHEMIQSRPYLFKGKNPDKAPGVRSLVSSSTISSGSVTYNREIYDGEDMISVGDIESEDDKGITYSINTRYHRPVIVGDSLYLKVGGAVYIKTPPANE